MRGDRLEQAAGWTYLVDKEVLEEVLERRKDDLAQYVGGSKVSLRGGGGGGGSTRSKGSSATRSLAARLKKETGTYTCEEERLEHDPAFDRADPSAGELTGEARRRDELRGG